MELITSHIFLQAEHMLFLYLLSHGEKNIQHFFFIYFDYYYYFEAVCVYTYVIGLFLGGKKNTRCIEHAKMSAEEQVFAYVCTNNNQSHYISALGYTKLIERLRITVRDNPL